LGYTVALVLFVLLVILLLLARSGWPSDKLSALPVVDLTVDSQQAVDCQSSMITVNLAVNC
jgi:hypothetical protein